MTRKALTECLTVAAILSVCLVPVRGFAAYEFYDDMDDPSAFTTNWEQSNGGNWELGTNGEFRSAMNDLTKDDTFAITDNDAAGTILYRVNTDGGAPPRNYQVSATISSGDRNTLGVVFYYVDKDNYYRLTVNNKAKGGTSGDPANPVKGTFVDYPHSIFLTRRTNGVDRLLAIAPWSGTHHAVRPYETVQLRVRVVTSSASMHKHILAQYYNPSIGAFVNLFDGVREDRDAQVNGGTVGAFANTKGTRPANGAGRLHRIQVESVESVFDIGPADEAHADASDPYLLDYKDSDGNGSNEVSLTHVEYAAAGSGTNVYWFLQHGAETTGPYGPCTNRAVVQISVPVGASRVCLHTNPAGTGTPVASKEVWVSSKSAFTVAVLPDLHVGQSPVRDYQVEAIMWEIKDRCSGDLPEDEIKACIQVGDMAYRGKSGQLQAARENFKILPWDMPLITAIGNHDYAPDLILFPGDELPLDRYSFSPDTFIYPLVSESERIKGRPGGEWGHGVETPNEHDNLYFLLAEDYLAGTNSGSGDWMVMSLQPNPLIRDLFWADAVLKTHKDYNVILVTHSFLLEDGSVENAPITHWTDYIDPDRGFNGVLFSGSTPGTELWSFLEQHDQIKIILSGHTTVEGGLFTTTVGRTEGSDALAMMTDISYTHPHDGFGGQFRLLEIDPGLSKVRARLAYARAHEHMATNYNPYALAGQAINAAHSDTYFIKGLDMSNDGCSDVWLFEDFNSGYAPYNNGLPEFWTAHDDAGPASHWAVDMSNEPDSPESVELVTGISQNGLTSRTLELISYNESNVRLKMSRFGRVQQTANTCSWTDFRGTYLAYEEPEAYTWSGYTFETDFSPGDNDGIGVMFYYTNTNSYYRFFIFNQVYYSGGSKRNYFLEKITPGENGPKRTVIKQGMSDYYYSQHTPYKIAVDLSRSGRIRIDVFDDVYDSGVTSEGNFLHLIVEDSTYSEGTIALFSWGMSDDEINDAGAIFDNVVVTGGDGTPPEITCGPDIIVSNDPGVCGARVYYDEPVGYAACSDVTTTRAEGMGPGSVFPVGTTRETYEVMNSFGLTASCSFTVTVIDAEFPIVICTTNVEVEPTSPAGTPVTYTEPIGVDNCSDAVTTRTDGPAPGDIFPIGITPVTYEVVDGASNAVSCTFTVKVLTPAEVCERIIERIEALVAADILKDSRANGLITTLLNIITKLESSPPLNPACNQIESFINQVMGHVKAGNLPAGNGYGWISSAINAGRGAGCVEVEDLGGTSTFDWGSYVYQAAAADIDGVIQGEASITANPAAYGLYTSNSIMDLSMGDLMLQTSNGLLRLRLQLEQTEDLTGGVWSNAGDAVEWLTPGGAGKRFYRVRGGKGNGPR